MSHDSQDSRTSKNSSRRAADDLPEDVLPQEVVAKLRALAATDVPVPAPIDQAILEDARSVLAASAKVRRKSTWRRWAAGIVTAGSLAALVVASFLPQWRPTEFPSSEVAQRAATPAEADRFEARPSADSGFATGGGMAVSASVAIAEDINGDGTVDILDAFALAQQIEQNQPVDGDVNQDGLIDDQDIRLVALAAVRL